MCGICGTIGFNSTELVEEMNRAMTHRGPDDIGTWHDNVVHMGHTRLSIIDPSSTGHQPMSNEDSSIWITYNGEIYNFLNIRKELEKKGHSFKSNTDTEVILHLYEEYKERCLENLCGMFSFAIWDTKEKKLFAARDRFGIKPFFYYFKNNRFIFSSELKGLLASGAIKKEINHKALKSYFMYGSVQSPQTIVKDVFQLKPAHYMVLKNDTLKIEKYWELDFSRTFSSRKSDSEYISTIKTTLDEAVKIRLVSDVPLGAFLSGGADSSSIVALMQKHSPKPVRTFSIIFEEEEYDERRFSRQVADAVGTDHTELFLQEKDILKEMPNILNSMDQPSIDGFNTFVISKAVKEAGLKVALSGLGGDEIFAGYASFRTLPRISNILGFAKVIPQGPKNKLFKLLKPLAKTKKTLKLFFSLLRCAELEDLYFLKRMVFLPDEVEQLLPEFMFGPGQNMDSSLANADVVNQLSFLEIDNYLQNTLLQDTDRMSMANSLEVRVPFLDHILVEKIFEIPGEAKVEGNRSKRLLREAMKDLLPEEIYNRPKKGFVFPFEQWLKKDLKSYCDRKFQKENLKDITFLDPDEVNRIWQSFLKGSKLYNYSSILSMLSFINWYERNV